MSATTLYQKTISSGRLFFSRPFNYLNLLKKTTALILSYALVFTPVYAYGGVLQLLHFEWEYDTATADLAGYKIYHNNNPVVDVNTPNTLTLDWQVLLETGAVNTFTMTAYDSSGNESSHSTPYSITVPADDGSGNVPPVPVIKANLTTGEAPLTIDFDGSGSYDFGGGIIINHAWDFGDGDTANGSTATHTYINAGSYTVWLVVTDDMGASSSVQATVTVTQPVGVNIPPTAAITATPTTGETPLTVNFNASASTDTDGSIVLYTWSFGDGNSGSGQTGSHTYTTAGTYTAIITVTDDDGATDTAQTTITINAPTPQNVPPIAAISANPLTGNAPLTTNFSGTGSTDSDGSIISYGWDFGDGDTGSGETVNHQFVSGGTYTVVITVTDNGGLSDQQQVQISINNIPTSANTSITTNEDSAFSGTLIASDLDAKPLTYSIVSNATKGTAVITNTATGAFIYTPNANATGADSFTFKVNDGKADSNTATVSVTINGINDIPTASNDSITTMKNVPSSGTLAAFDTEGDPLTYSIVTNPTKGTTVITNTATGAVTYTPNANATGADSFTFKANDGKADSNTATIAVTITAANDAPVAANDTATTNEDTAKTITVLANDTDADGDTLTVSAVTQGSNGAVTINGTTVTYTPKANWSGADSFTYTVSDGNGGTDTATVSMTVTAVNHAPTASSVSVTTDEDTATSGLLPAVDTDGDTLTYSITANAAKGKAIITNQATGAFTYTPNANATGADSFTFKTNDGKADSNTATIAVTITAANDAPVAANDTATTNEDTAKTITVLANDTDADGDILTVSAITQGSNGAVTINGTTVTYTPKANWSGADSFTYTVSDGNGGNDTATVNITVTAANDTPTAIDDTTTVSEDNTVTIDVLANDTDADGDSLTVSTVTQGSNGSVTTNGTTVTFTPKANWFGTDSFSYTVGDGNNGNDTATVNITVTAVNDVPTTSSINTATDEDTATIGLLPATDPDGDALTYSIVSNATKGTAVITNTATGAFIYTPNANVSGADSFTFRVNDGKADSNTSTVPVTINSINDIPTASGDSLTTVEDTPTSSTLAAFDTEGDPLVYSIVTNPAKGKALITNTATGAFTYTPNANATGADSFTFKANDGKADSNTATIAVAITAANDAPVAADDTATTNEDTAATITVLANDTDADGDTLTVSAVTQGSNGAVTINGTTVTYTPKANWFGSDSFYYTVSDGNGGTDTASINITVNAVPVAAISNITTNEDNVITGTLTATDQDNVNLTYRIMSNGTLGTAVITDNAAGTFTYSPMTNISGTDSFTFVANDGKIDSQSATVTVTVLPVNDPPSAMDDLATTQVNQAVTINVLANDSDIEGGILTMTSTSPGNFGTVTFDSQKATYTPGENFSGTDTFTYTTEDPEGGKASALATVEVQSSGGLTPAPRADKRKERNYPPIASNSSYSINEDTVLRGQAKATDQEGSQLTYAVSTLPAHGVVTLIPASGSFVYTPKTDYSGLDRFTFTASDGQFDSKPGTIYIVVSPVNDAPTATPDSVIIDSGAMVSINVLANDFDPDKDPLVVTSATNGTYGTTKVTANKIIYTPKAGYAGQDEFTYVVSDYNRGTATGKVTVTILPANGKPLAVSNTVTVPQNAPMAILLNATDPENDLLTYTIVNFPTKGILSRTETQGTYLYTPNTNATGTDSVTFTASDGTSVSNQATVTINIAPLPLAVAGGPYYGFVGSPISFDASKSSSTGTQIILYEWDWNDDGIFDEKIQPPSLTAQHIWTAPYKGDINLKITDTLGKTSTAKATVDIVVLGDQDGDYDFDNSDAAIFEKNYPVALGACTGDRNYTRAMDLNSDGCITALDMNIFQTIKPQ